MHEEGSVQNRKNKEIVEVGLKSICQEIQTKATDSQLTDKIKEILRKYDQGDLLDEGEGLSLLANSSNFPHSPKKESLSKVSSMSGSERRAGKASYEDHYRLKDELEGQINKIKKHLHESDVQAHQNKERIVHCASLLDLHEAEIRSQKIDQSKLHSEHKNGSKYYLE